MCGIIAGFSKKGKKISKSILKRYNNQKTRGSQGFGYVAIYKDRISVGRSVDESGIRDKLMKETTGMCMFHHRQPTSTPNIEEATHPIYVSNAELDYDYYIVHNGVISNDTKLKTKHEELGYVYTTSIDVEVITHNTAKKSGKKYYTPVSKIEKFNDSESLAIEIARCLDGMQRTINAVGSIAFVCYKLNKETNTLMSISYGHNSGRPLTVTDNNDHFFLTSEGGEDLPINVLFTLHTSGEDIGTIEEKELSIGYITEWGLSQKDKVIHQLPAPAPQLGLYIREGKTYKDYNEYHRERYGIDRDDGHTRHVRQFGFDLNQGRELDWDEKLVENADIDTTGDDFMEESRKMVYKYIELQDALKDTQDNINTGEWMLKDTTDPKLYIGIKNDIKGYEKELDDLQNEMNHIEEKYYDTFGTNRPSWKTLVDAYIDQDLSEMAVLCNDGLVF